MRLWPAAILGLLTLGCAAQPHEINLNYPPGAVLRYPRPEIAQTVKNVRYSATEFFSSDAQHCLAKVVDMLLEDKPGAEKHNLNGISLNYHDGTGIAAVHNDYIMSGNALEIRFHESMHGLENCDLLKRDEFMTLYTAVDKKEFPIIEAIENWLNQKPYNSGKFDLNSERMTLAPQLALFYGHALPELWTKFYGHIFGSKINNVLKKALEKHMKN